jgi:hypothetical protein
LFVLSLNESEFRLGSRLAEDKCADGFFRNGHVALPTDPIVADQIIDNRWRNSMTRERVDTISRGALVDNEEINVAVNIVEQLALSIDLHNSACSRGGSATDTTVGRTRILTGEVIAGNCGCSHVGAFQCWVH